MLPTHALFGMLLALPVVVLAPEHGAVALAAGLAGGILPDLDLYTGHRKTLHYPVGYSLIAAITAVGAALQPTVVVIGAAVLFAGAGLHCLLDVFGGGLELRPWEATSERAVYDHVRGRWIAPRRWVRYDGAPEDLLLSVGVAVPVLALADPPFRPVVLAAVGVGVVYAASRRTLPEIARRLATEILPGRVPAAVLARVPERYRGDAEGTGRGN